MKVDEVIQRVEAVRMAAGDEEGAHLREDELWADVLVAIANGADDAMSLAQAALRTKAMAFQRWCA